MFDSVDQISLGLAAVNGMIATATWVPERMQAAADNEASAATDLAEWLVQRGMPFRDAHALVGTLVRKALAGEGSLRALVAADVALGPDAAELVAPGVVGEAASHARWRRARTRGRSDRAIHRAPRSTSRQRWREATRPSTSSSATRSTSPRTSSTSCWSSRLAARITEVEAYTAGRPGESQLPGPNEAQRRDVRTTRAPLRVLRLRDALLRQHRHRCRR